MIKEFDIVFIGSGPAGYTGAIRAAQLGKSVAIIEAAFIGGVCLNRGCIPTKSLLHSAQAFANLKSIEKYGVTVENPSFDFTKMIELRSSTIEKIRASLTRTIENNGVEIIKGTAKFDENQKLFVATNEENIEIKYNHLVIATGSKPKRLTSLPTDKTLTSDTILAQKTLPEKTLIIGSGAIGTEWARILNSLGKKVCVIELAKKLIPTMDESVSDTLSRIFKKQRIEFYTDVHIDKIEENKAFLSNGKEIEFDKILVAIGREANLKGFENLPLETVNDFIKTDENFKTNITNIYAVGDITGKQLLAHTAAAQSKKLVEYLFESKKIEINYKNIPGIIYGKPEIAGVGYTEQELKESNVNYKVSKLPLTIAAKAYIDGEMDGMIKVLSIDNIIVGASVVANDASGLLQQLIMAIETKTTVDKLNEIIYAHPTTSEAISEAILNLEDKALFVPKKI